MYKQKCRLTILIFRSFSLNNIFKIGSTCHKVPVSNKLKTTTTSMNLQPPNYFVKESTVDTPLRVREAPLWKVSPAFGIWQFGGGEDKPGSAWFRAHMFRKMFNNATQCPNRWSTFHKSLVTTLFACWSLNAPGQQYNNYNIEKRQHYNHNRSSNDNDTTTTTTGNKLLWRIGTVVFDIRIAILGT